MAEHPDVDSFGQVKVPYKWHNVFTWPPAHKFALYGSVVGFCSFLMFNRFNRRPYYAGIIYSVPTTGSLGILGYCVGRYREYSARNRDAVVAHYISLHPEDFSHLSDTGRRWKDILLPWQPVRYYESPYKWTPDSKAAAPDFKDQQQ